MIMASHFPQLIIIIKNSKIAPKVQTKFYFQTWCWLVYITKETSTKNIGLIHLQVAYFLDSI